MDINYYMKLQNAYGTKNRREKQLVKVNQNMSKHFGDTFDTEMVLKNGEPFELMIVHDTEGNTFKKKIKSRHDEKFNLGDYIEWKGQVWLVTLLDVDDKTWNRGYMYQCSILLRWQNSNGDIIERWGYSEDFTKYSTGVKGNNTITQGDYQYGLTLPVDDETKVVKRDRRFPIDIEGVEPPDIYELSNRKILLTDNRAIGRGGIMTWTLSYSEFNKDTDKKIELPNGTKVWICDYRSPIPSEIPPDEMMVQSAKISGNQNLKCGFSRIYTVTFNDSNGNEVNWRDVSFSWDVKCNFNIQPTVKGNTIELYTNEPSLVGEAFLLSVKVAEEIVAEIQVNIIEGW